MKVGFIGLGIMGAPIAANMLKSGYDLTVYNRDRRKCEPLAEAGASIADDLGDLADVDVLVTMVTGDDALTDIFLTRGLAAALKPGAIHLSCSTISVAIVERLREAFGDRNALVAAPVVGRSDRAAARTLGVIMSGPADAKAVCRPLMETTSSRIFDLGDEPGAAVAAKIANNFMIGATIEMLAEAFSITDRHGVARAEFLDFLTQTLFAAPIVRIYGDLILGETFEPAGSPLAIGIKDMLLATDVAEGAGRTLPFADTVLRNLRAADTAGHGKADWAILGSRDLQWLR